MNKPKIVEPNRDPRPLDEVELDTVSGGFGFVERGIVIIGGEPYKPATGTFFLRKTPELHARRELVARLTIRSSRDRLA